MTRALSNHGFTAVMMRVMACFNALLIETEMVTNTYYFVERWIVQKACSVSVSDCDPQETRRCTRCLGILCPFGGLILLYFVAVEYS